MANDSLIKNFGSNVFSLSVMKEYLPENVFSGMEEIMEGRKQLNAEVAESLAAAMKNWAVEKGATHYTHWFQPMTSLSAEKHEAFLTPSKSGEPLLEFSYKELIKSEPDASSFPSGGLRATFEARGYTSFDPTVPAFIKNHTLYIPSSFCSFGGEILDKKTPLLRSMDAVNREALKLLSLLSYSHKRVITMVGAEQEYFLIDKKHYDARKDLRLTNKTLFGAQPPMGQVLVYHYYGNIKERVSAFMKELDHELWLLGIYAKTEHNESAPSQHELAPVYTNANLACDQNQLIMEEMKTVALRHGLVCLLHEKPFEGVNGSGKHCNWSLSTDDGENLLAPGKNPEENIKFLLFFSAVIKALDEYGDLLRYCAASPGNDHRLGGNEAPPAIVSAFIGEELERFFLDFAEGNPQEVKLKDESEGAELISFFKDASDRNRTSPFAFTGNKFEFRMLGSSQSIAGTCIVLNTIVAEILSSFYKELENASNIEEEVRSLVKRTISEHKRIIFSGNNYTKEWEEEAKQRGLSNLRTTVDALPVYISDKAKELFSRHDIFTPAELEARYEVKLSSYIKTINIEALTMVEVARQEILPACLHYSKMLYDRMNAKKEAGFAVSRLEQRDTTRISIELDGFYEYVDKLAMLLETIPHMQNIETAKAYQQRVIPIMKKLRHSADELEGIVGKEYWPFPTYSDILF